MKSLIIINYKILNLNYLINKKVEIIIIAFYFLKILIFPYVHFHLLKDEFVHKINKIQIPYKIINFYFFNYKNNLQNFINVLNLDIYDLFLNDCNKYNFIMNLYLFQYLHYGYIIYLVLYIHIILIIMVYFFSLYAFKYN